MRASQAGKLQHLARHRFGAADRLELARMLPGMHRQELKPLPGGQGAEVGHRHTSRGADSTAAGSFLTEGKTFGPGAAATLNSSTAVE
jgi:hypothetical protein